MIRLNNSLQRIKADQNHFTTLGVVRLLYALKYNQTLVKLQAENNRVRVCRRLLGLIGDLVIYHNRSLRVLILTVHANILTHLKGDNESTSQKLSGCSDAIFRKPEHVPKTAVKA